MGSKSNDKCPYKRHTGERQKEVGHVMMEAEMGVMQPQAKGGLEPPETR